MTEFSYHPDILSAFPEIVGGIIHVNGFTNSETPAELRAYFTEVQQEVRQKIGDKSLSELPSIAAWRQAFRKFGTDPTKYRCAAEALLRRLTKKDDIPFINTLVDMGNLISIKYALPVAVIDTRQVVGDITVHFADGTENFTDLGQSESPHPDVGEVVFTDANHTVYARRWCWRQGVEGTANLKTEDVIITIEAQHQGGESVVRDALAEFRDLINQYTPGDLRSMILTA
ncbi:MAG TPA: phenylalanine--tRNA ligase beta subunit-related protein [Phototrophicaceae bacterium]|nr:phenylalanine--tRNA ligase beta subunit-related protein [Phototrophicaceae bacterium]